ncbi:hypothetical protein L211DRAFT_866456 [Terfezia boudieri ATCC MYA-4762]|uniref:Uncharacterized protein n=1 Tax=Terfezia boudieri ATCC MYA-4762 TaxID=1051890 RepID=A0A3N4LUW2_9PEZI|nr:hypothetical protein L211DRAFT_866456 [Terfezia boudieri ATCC MYA-4762]
MTLEHALPYLIAALPNNLRDSGGEDNLLDILVLELSDGTPEPLSSSQWPPQSVMYSPFSSANMNRGGRRFRDYHPVPSYTRLSSTDRGHKPANVASTPPLPTAPDSDDDIDIPSSQISPTNTIRMPRTVNRFVAARLARGRKPRYTTAQQVDKLFRKFAARKAKLAPNEANMETHDAVQAKYKETMKQQVAKLKDFGKDMFGSIRAKATGVKPPDDEDESRLLALAVREMFDSRESFTNCGDSLQGEPEGPPSTATRLRSTKQRRGAIAGLCSHEAQGEQPISDGNPYLINTQIRPADPADKGKAKANPIDCFTVLGHNQSGRTNGSSQAHTDLSLDQQPLINAIDETIDSLSTHTTEMPPSNFLGREQTDNIADEEQLGDPGDWLPWFQYPNIPGVSLGPRLQLYEYPEIENFRKQWMESQSERAIGDAASHANTPATNFKPGNRTTIAESSASAARAEADRDRTHTNRTGIKGSERIDGTPKGETSRNAMIEREKVKALLQQVSASTNSGSRTTRSNLGSSNIQGFSSVWDQVGSRPAPSGATSATLARPNRPGSILSADTKGSYPGNTAAITNRDHTAFAVGNLVEGVTRVCLARDMPGLSSAVSDSKKPKIVVTSESGGKGEILPEGGSVTISSAGPQVQDMYGAGPFRDGLLSSPSEGPSNVLRFEQNGVTYYTTVDAVRELQNEKTSKDAQPAVEKKRNRVSEWFNRFKDTETTQPKVDNLNQPPSSKSGESSMGTSTLANDNTQRDRREPIRPPNSENYTFTPRLPPPSSTAFVYGQDDTNEPEDAHTNGPDAPHRYEPNRLLTIDLSSDTTAMSDRAKKRLVEAREVAIQQATIRLRKAQEHDGAKCQAEIRPQTIGKPPLEARDAAMKEAAARPLQAQALIDAKKAAKQAAKQEGNRNPVENTETALPEARDIIMKQAPIRPQQAQARPEAKQTEFTPVETAGEPPEDALAIAMKQAVIRLLKAQERMDAERAERDRVEGNPRDIAIQQSAMRLSQLQARLKANKVATQAEKSNPVESTEAQLETIGNGNLAVQGKQHNDNTPAHTPRVSSPPSIFQPVDYNAPPTSYSPYDAYPSCRSDGVAPLATSSPATSSKGKDTEAKSESETKKTVDSPPGPSDNAPALNYGRFRHPRPPIPEMFLEGPSKQSGDE